MTIEESWEALRKALKEDQRIKGYEKTLRLLTPEEEFFAISVESLKEWREIIEKILGKGCACFNFEEELVNLMESEYDKGRL